MTREVWRVARPGSARGLVREVEPTGDLAPDRVRIAVRAVGLNFADAFAIQGLYEAAPKDAFVPGLEVCGVVERVGASAGARFAPGMRVMAVARFGGYATSIDLAPDFLAPLPEAWSFEEGAAHPVQALTAYYAAVELGALERGACVLVHSAAGGVGVQLLRIGRRYDAFLIGTVGHADKLPVLEREGCNVSIVRGRNLEGQIREAVGGRKLTLVLDAVGGDVLAASYRALAPTGRLVTYGAANLATPGSRPHYLALAWRYLRRPRLDPLDLIAKNKAVLGFNLIWLYEQKALLDRILRGIEALDLPAPLVGERHSWAELPAAVERLRSGRTVGKVVVGVPD